MAECIVEVCKIDKILDHPNADLLELAYIKGWQCVIPKGKYKSGDLVTYIPIDSMIPLEHSDRWGITKYLSVSPVESTAGRVRCARLRGEPSFGVIINAEHPFWTEGEDVKDFYGIFKYVPPLKPTAGDAEEAHPLFVSYTDIENLRNYPDVFKEGEQVVVTEKIHGTNCRIGVIDGEVMAGSMGLRRKQPATIEEMARNTYWFPFTLEPVRNMLKALGEQYKQVILFGEVFGSSVQSLHYGHKGKFGFRAFDILIDGKYVDTARFNFYCDEMGVEKVPVLYRGPFFPEKIIDLSNGATTLPDSHIREGVVVKPRTERTHPMVGRVVMKYISDAYLLSKSAERDTNDV